MYIDQLNEARYRLLSFKKIVNAKLECTYIQTSIRIKSKDRLNMKLN